LAVKLSLIVVAYATSCQKPSRFMNYFKFSPNSHTSSRDFIWFYSDNKWVAFICICQVHTRYTVHQPLHSKNCKSSTTKL